MKTNIDFDEELFFRSRFKTLTVKREHVSFRDAILLVIINESEHEIDMKDILELHFHSTYIVQGDEKWRIIKKESPKEVRLQKMGTGRLRVHPEDLVSWIKRVRQSLKEKAEASKKPKKKKVKVH